MCKYPKSQCDRYFFPTANPGIKPGDFPVGSIQSRAAARAMVASYMEEQHKREAIELGNLTPIEQAMIEDGESPSVRTLMVRLIRGAQERKKLYELQWPWPTPEEIRHNRAVAKEIDRITGGKALVLQMGDSKEWKRQKVIAEENLRAKKK